MRNINDVRLKVCGDGNCGYYACLTSCDMCALDHPRSHRAPTGRDYTKQAKLRADCVEWLLHADQLPFCLNEHGCLVKHETVILDGEAVTRPCEPPIRDDNAIKRHLQGKRSAGAPMGVYANSPLLRAMAAVKGVYLAVIDTDKLHDRVTVYPPQTCTTSYHGWSWAEEIVPKLQQQTAGKLAGPHIVVAVWNGQTDASGHFDAMCSLV